MKTGSVSVNRPSVTSMTSPSAILAIRMRRSGCGPGWAQASQAESGDQDSPSTAPSSDEASSVTCPDATSTASSLPSWAAAATVAPSGEAARLSTLPRRPSAIRTVSSSPVTGPISSASAPAASVTQAACPVSPSTCGSRARAAGSTCSARAGPSLCVSQCTVPRTSTTLAWPVMSVLRLPRWSAAETSRGERAAAGEPRAMSSGRGSGASGESRIQMSPATW